MEDIIKSVVLGIIQGLTEFLPISSTAHLRIVPSFFGWGDIGAAYTAVIQVGTMIAIILYFRKDLLNMFNSLVLSVKEKTYMTKPNTRLLFMVCVGTIPILIFGYLFKDFIRHDFRNMFVMAGSLILFSLVILAGERYTRKKVTIEKLSMADAIIIGFFQSLALVPGTSRSGSTIAGGFFRNMDRESAARYSFLLSIPAILISGFYELYSEREQLFSNGSGAASLIIATAVSGIVGYASIWFLLSYLKRHSMMIFIVYRILLGVLIIILLNLKFISN